MLIDWFTVVAQAVNFLILLWLMKRFLYAPILRAVDAREQRIAAELKDAAAKQSEANKEREDFERKNEVFDQQRADLLGKATAEVESQRKAMLEQARTTADDWIAKRQEALRTEADGLNRTIEDSARGEVLAIIRKALQDLATTDLESSMAEILMRRLRALDGKAKADLVAALGTISTAAIVSSAFELPAQERAAIQQLLLQMFGSDAPLRFEIRPELVCGIELSVNGQIVAWNVDGYLQSLKKEIERISSERTSPAMAAVAAADGQGGLPGKDTRSADTEVAEDPSTAAAAPAQVSAA